MEPRKKFTLLEDVQDLDKTIIRLIAKRTELVQRMEQNRSKTAFVAAKIAASEKDLRKNWEHEASTYSRDERFLRGVFALLQELELTPKESKDKTSNVFNLAPPPRPHPALRRPGARAGRGSRPDRLPARARVGALHLRQRTLPPAEERRDRRLRAAARIGSLPRPQGAAPQRRKYVGRRRFMGFGGRGQYLRRRRREPPGQLLAGRQLRLHRLHRRRAPPVVRRTPRDERRKKRRRCRAELTLPLSIA